MSALRKYFASLSLLSLFAAPVLLTGCGVGTINTVQTNVPSGHIAGKVFGGQNPISGADIYVMSAGVDTTGSPSSYGVAGTMLGHTTTDAGGNFSFLSNGTSTIVCPQSNTPVYLLSVGGDSGSGTNANAVLAAPLGSCSTAQSENLVMNEVTTIATAYALQGYFTTTFGQDPTTTNPYTYDTFGGPGSTYNSTISYPQGLVLGNTYTSQRVVYNANGLAAVSNGILSAEPLKVYSLANILGACVNSGGTTGVGDNSSPCYQLFCLTSTGSTASISNGVVSCTNNGGATPSDTLQAAVQLARYPNHNVAELFTYPGAHVAFEADLSSAPADWSLAVSYTSSTMGLGVDSNTLSTIDIDQNNDVWFPSNIGINQTTQVDYTGAGYLDPHSNLGTFEGPYNPGNTLQHPEQVAIDGNGYAWYTDTQGAAIIGFNTSSPSSYATQTLPNTTSYSVAVGNVISPVTASLNTVVKVGLYDASSGGSATPGYKFATFNVADNLSYTEDTLPSGGLPALPYSITSNSNTSNNYLVLFSNGSNNLSYDLYDDGYTDGNTPALTNEDTTTGLPGQVSFNGYDVFGVRGYTGSGTQDGFCFAGTQTTGCYPFSGTAVEDIPSGLAVDGAGTAWVADEANGTVQFAPYYSGTTYVNNNAIATNILNHNASNGGTALNPEGIAIDGEGDVWVSNAGCTGGGSGGISTVCTPGSLVLTEYIGAGYPTITPVSGQITGGDKASTPPTY